jgi:hypothetical protein
MDIIELSDVDTYEEDSFFKDTQVFQVSLKVLINYKLLIKF